MAKPVVVVEAAGKGQTLKEHYSGEFDELVVTSPPVAVSYVPPKDKLRKGAPKFTFALQAKEKNFWKKLLAAQGRDVYLALDSDQRGEFWAWSINEYLASVNSGAELPKRLNLHGLSGAVLDESFRVLDPVQSERATAYYIRMLFESSLGRHLKRLLGTRSGPNNLAMNYVSLTTLNLLAERETEIKMYTPISRWQVRVKLATDKGEFSVLLQEAYGITDDGYVRNVEEGKRAIDLFKNKSFILSEKATDPIKLPPPAPYRLVELLQDAWALYKMTPLAAMSALRNLFYGVDFDGKPHGLITAFTPHADVSDETLLEAVAEQVAARFGEESVGEGENAEDLPGIILPTMPELGKEEVAGKLTGNELHLYELIWSRALASQMQAAEGETIEATITAGKDCFFRATERSITEQGYLALYQSEKDKALLAPCPLAGMGEGWFFEVKQISPEKTMGYPPEYYTFDGLATDLADFGVEVDASFVVMIQQFIDKGYLAMMPDGTLRCGQNTGKLLSVLNRAFPSMKGINLPAYLAQTIEEVVTNRKPLAFALQQFDQTMMMRGEVLVKIAVPMTARLGKKKSKRIIKGDAEPAVPPKPMPLESLEEPPAVRGEVAKEPVVEEVVPPEEAPAIEEEKEAPSVEPEVVEPKIAEEEEAVVESESEPEPEPEAVAEGGAPAEEAIAEEDEIVTVSEEDVETPSEDSAEAAQAAEKIFAEAQVEEETSLKDPAQQEAPEAITPATAKGPTKDCPDCARPMLLKEDRFGKYWYCSGHPECRHSESFEKEGAGMQMLCPLCNIGNVVTKHTPTGKLFYVCPEQDCEFMAWAKPLALPCRVCNSPYLVEKKNIGGRAYLRCPRAGCNYMQPLPGDDNPEALLPSAQPKKKKKVRVRRVKGGAKSSGGKRKVRVVRRKK